MVFKKGFTLIELLVVIAIIALLLGIMIPSLSMVKRKAQGVVCQSNTRQMVMAWFVYAGDNNSNMVGGNTNYRLDADKNTWTYGWVKPPQEEDGTAVPGEWVADPDAVTLENEIRGIERGYLYPYMDDSGLYHCPGAKEIIVDGGYRSYSIIGLMNGEQAGSFPAHAVTKTLNVVRPNTKVVFVENTDARGWNMGSWIFDNNDLGASPAWTHWGDPLAIWHVKSSSMGFADGHAEVHKWQSDSTVYMAENQLWGVDPLSPPAGITFDGKTDDIDFMFNACLPRK